MASARGEFGSRFGFVMAAAGSAVGLGNIWGFPTQAASNGGAAFLLVYLVLAFTLAYPALMAELIIGRHAHANAVTALGELSNNRLQRRIGRTTGTLGFIVASLILSFYAIVAGWMMAFCLSSFATVFGGDEIASWLTSFGFVRNELGTLVFKSSGDLDRVLAYDDFLSAQAEHWLAREIILYWKRVLQRVELSARSLFALVEPGSCFAGTLLELVLGADRSFMLEGQFEGDNRPPPALMLSGLNFGPLPMVHGLTRLASRYPEAPEQAAALQTQCGIELDASAAEQARLVTFIPDDIDWEDEVRIALEERASFSPDALTGMEANLRFGGPETAQSKIFARLSAWQNWIFQRPNAVGADGALQLYGTGRRSTFDKQRV